MNLQRKLIPGVEEFDQQWNVVSLQPGCAEQLLAMMRNKPVQVLARERPVGDNADITKSITDFPRFADQNAGRQFLPVQAFEIPPAPDALLEDRLKYQRIKHERIDDCNLRSGRTVWDHLAAFSANPSRWIRRTVSRAHVTKAVAAAAGRRDVFLVVAFSAGVSGFSRKCPKARYFS